MVEIYGWVRKLALRIALRALLGMEATDGRERTLASAFEASLAIHGEPVPLQMLPAPALRWRARSRLGARWIWRCARRSTSAGTEVIRAGACSACC